MSGIRDMQTFIRKNLTLTPPDGSGLKVGAKVEWVNDYGIKWQNKIIGFNYDDWYNKKYTRFVHLDTDTYWFPHDHRTLTLI